MSLTAREVLHEIIQHIKTLPVIKSCNIEMNPDNIFILNINNLNFCLNKETSIRNCLIEDEIFNAHLIQMEIKQSQISEFCELITNLHNKNLSLYNLKSHCNTSLFNISFNYSRIEELK